MRQVETTGVLVVGAGPVGLLLGCELARRGIDVRVVDKKSGVIATGARGRALSSRSLEVFEDLGLADRIYALGRRNPRVRLYDHRTVLSDIDPAADPAGQPTPDSPHRCSGFALAQQTTENILAEHLAFLGVRVELDCELADLASYPDHTIATVRAGGTTRQIRAEFVVGCDGGSSTVRTRAGIPFLGETWDQEHYINGCVELDGLDPEIAHIWLDTAQGMVFLSWQPDFERWVFFVAVAPGEDGELPPPSARTLRRIFDERCGLEGVTFGATSLTSRWRPNIRMAARFRRGRILLAGDAAHVHSPAGGQGMNTGLQDAYNLGWKLAHVLRGAPEALLDTYEAERFPIARELLTTTSRRHRAYHQTPDAQERNAALRDTILANDTFSDTTQLAISYRGGPLARDAGAAATGVRAGDRAPDAPCVRAGGTERVRLFDTFRGTHFTLLVFGETAMSVPVPASADDLRVHRIRRPGAPPGHGDGDGDGDGDVLVDVDGHAHHAYGVTDAAAVLVRPDGYIGLTDSEPTPERIADYLAMTR